MGLRLGKCFPKELGTLQHCKECRKERDAFGTKEEPGEGKRGLSFSDKVAKVCIARFKDWGKWSWEEGSQARS